ncbi:MAG: ABC transporter ATP-binding protein [Clostridia bacterium]|nr:ABC transporter ATP-binding protein [Clostridia bacterium]
MKRWFKYIKPYKKFFILGPLCMIIESVGEIFMPLLLRLITQRIIEPTESGSDIGFIALIGGAMILLALIMMAGGIGGAYFGAKSSVNFAADLRSDIYKKVQRFSFANIDKFSTGSLVTRLTNDVTQLQNFVNMLVRMCLRAPIMLIGALIMAISLDITLSSSLAFAVPLILIVQAVIIKIGFKRFGQVQKSIDGLNSTVQENVTNVRVVKSFVREEHEKKKFHKANGGLKKAGIRAMNVMIFMHPLMMIIMNVTTMAVVVIGAHLIDKSSGLDPATLGTFITYINQILMSLMFVTMMFMNSSRALASAKRICEVLDEKIDIDDANASQKDKTVEKGAIEFKNVGYRYYKTSEEAVLKNISLTIPAGSTVGIVGSTGCGKTTLVSMIPRLYDVDEGEVLIDGINVKEYSLYNLREAVGMVLQKNVLFTGSIKENLLWGNSEASDDDIQKACESAQADKFIKNFTDGYESNLGQGGSNVSGGQKQRLCIARALLKNPKIIILDDSTSAVDTATEAMIRKAFREDIKDSTKIIIAQRISSVIDSDMIVVMDDGVITGVGTHDELLENNREYQEIYYSQNGGDKDGKKS